MGGVRHRRLEGLEHRRRERTLAPRPEPTHEELKRRWHDLAKVRRSNDTHSREEFNVRDLTNLLRKRGEFDGMGIEGFRGRLREWRPPLDEGAIERVTARMAFDGEPPAEEMECPPEWRGAFEAADELRGLFESADPEALARAYVAAEDAAEEEGEAAADGLFTAMLAPLGITTELRREAIGPDAEGVPEEERERRICEALGDFYYGERGYEVQRQIWRIIDEREEHAS